MRRLALAILLLMPVHALAGYGEGVAAFARGDNVRAAYEFRRAAEAGDAQSAYMLGRLYALGSGVPQDWVMAWVWQDRAVAQGVAEAGDERATLEEVMSPAQLDEARRLAAGLSEPAPAVEGSRRQVVIIPRTQPEQQAERP